MNPCFSNPCKFGEDCIPSNDGTMSYVCESFCDRMKPCNNNSQCIYLKENNTFTCRCLNGASSCDSNSNTDINYMTTSTMIGSLFTTNLYEEKTTQFEPKSISNDAVDLPKIPNVDTKSQSSDIPKFGFNYENVKFKSLDPFLLLLVQINLFISLSYIYCYQWAWWLLS